LQFGVHQLGYLSNVSAELLANVSPLRDFLLFRQKPDLCSLLFDTDEIATLSVCTG